MWSYFFNQINTCFFQEAFFRDHTYCTTTSQGNLQDGPAVHEHNYSISQNAGDSSNTILVPGSPPPAAELAEGDRMITVDVLLEDVVVDGVVDHALEPDGVLPHSVLPDAGDPELEQLKYNSVAGDYKAKRIPAAAWVLTTVYLLSMLQKSYSDNVICELYRLVAEGQTRESKQNQPYSKRVMIFCMTLAGYSWHAYSFLRTTLNNCIPSRSTLIKYRNKIDGSPGFSLAALQMVKNKVQQLAAESKMLYLSLSCDDMSIRYKIYVHYLYSVHSAE
jgi:hypothetical protein